MAVRASSPLTVLFVSPPDRDGAVPHGLVGSTPLLSELLCIEVAACAAAVGHRLRVVSRPEWLAAAHAHRAASAPPALILWGLAPGDTADPEPQPGSDGGQGRSEPPIVAVTLDGSSAPPGALCLPSRSQQLCRILARTGPANSEPLARGRAAVVVHDGPGVDGDEHWPGLSWALALLLGGPGRGLLVDAQGPQGSLSARLRALAPPVDRCVSWEGMQDLPVPGPALASHLPGAGGVRWWGWASSESTDGPRTSDHWAQVAVETFPWTVVDVGKDQDRARDWAERGVALLVCTDRGPAAGRQLPADVLLHITPRQRPSRAPRHRDARRGSALAREPAGSVRVKAQDWDGASLASWIRSSRRRSARRLAAEIDLRLDGAGTLEPGWPAAGRTLR
ncbi:hypothetical protein LG293_03125 [Citricoccus nitrophenolicus]|uniref:Uncharacterized protein n=1 Tax=Citricoccus muralis TaxID=169134 RepID=A0A3D9LCD1_9MICC|nr:hypothetical protein C8E99_1843 [Citricoccus muralis]